MKIFDDGLSSADTVETNSNVSKSEISNNFQKTANNVYDFLNDVPEIRRYSRGEIFSAWSEIRREIGEEGDIMFSACLEGTTLSSDDMESTPFPLTLSFKSNQDGSPSWGFTQFNQNEEFGQKLVSRFQSLLDTPVFLNIILQKAEPGHAVPKRPLTAFEKDLEIDTNLRKLTEIFHTEFLASRRLPPERRQIPKVTEIEI